MKLNWKVETNPTTGEKALVAGLTTELVSVAKNPIANANGTMYYPATVRYENEKGDTVTRGALVYEANFNYGLTVGNVYSAKVIKAVGKLPLIVMSHLERAGSASDEDFDFDLSLLEAVDFDAVSKK